MLDIRQGDCLAGLRSLPDESVDLFVTSPPFNLGGDFKSSHHDGRMVHYGDYGVHDDNMPEDEYQAWQVEVLAECFRVLKPAGSMYYQHKVRIKGGVMIHPLSWLAKSPFVLKQEITIRFPGTVNNDKIRFLPTAERLYWLTKQADTKLVDQRCAAYTDVWDINHIRSRQKVGHPAAFDNELPRRCILSSSKVGDVVCDPFTGSGTTPEEAAALQRDFIGWELNPAYVEVVKRRLAKVQSTLVAEM